MKTIKLFLPVLFVLALFSPAPAQNKFYGKVVEVLDGRTMIIEPQPKVQIKLELQYIEVPEPEQELAAAIKDHLTKMVLGQTVVFEPKSMSDTRNTGQVFLKGVDVSQQMLRDGAAWYALPEKTLQDEAQSTVYLGNEQMARNEKRGIWSVPGLKPAWEFRAEKEEQERRAELKRKEEENAAEIARLTGPKAPAPRSRNSRLTPEERARANAGVQIWADVSNYSFLTKSNVLSMIGDGPLSDEPVSGFDPASGRNYMATPLSVLNVTYTNSEIKLLGMLMYFAPPKDSGEKGGMYLLGLMSEAAAEKFANAAKLTIVTEKTKIVSESAQRVVTPMPNGVRERLYYALSREDLMNIKTAEKLSVSLGEYSGTVDGKFLKRIQGLLERLK